MPEYQGEPSPAPTTASGDLFTIRIGRGDNLADRLRRSALRLFLANGYANTKTKAIAKDAGTTESSMYRIFESKTQLFRTVYDSCWGEVNELIARATYVPASGPTTAVDDLINDIDTLLGAYDHADMRHIVVFAFVYYRRGQELGADYKAPQEAHFEDRLRAHAKRVIHEQSTDSRYDDPDQLASLVLSYIISVWLMWYPQVDQMRRVPTLDTVREQFRQLVSPRSDGMPDEDMLGLLADVEKSVAPG